MHAVAANRAATFESPIAAVLVLKNDFNSIFYCSENNTQNRNETEDEKSLQAIIEANSLLFRQNI